MIRLNNIVFCDNTQQIPSSDNSTVTVITIPFPELCPPYIPGLFSFAVSFGVSGIDADTSYDVSLVFSSPKGKILSTCTVPLVLPKDMFNITCNVDFRNVLFEEEGVYQLCIQIKDVKRTEFISVRKGGAL